MVVTRDQLYRLIDALPDEELEVAAHVLEELAQPSSHLNAIDTDIIDDEPYTDEQRAAVAKALIDVEAGRTLTTEELLKALDHEEG